MKLDDNFSLFNLFLDKKVRMYIDNKFIYIRVPTIRDLQLNDYVNATYHIANTDTKKLQKMAGSVEISSSLDYIKLLIFQLGMFQEYSELVSNIKTGLEFFIPGVEIDFKSKQLIVDNITITQEIWEYILYLLKLSCGEKVEKPRIFGSEAERQFYLAQKEMEEKIKKIKAQKPGDSDGLLKAFLTIQYKFNLSFDYLAEQTLAQIHWLQEYAAGAVSYEVNAQAMAAGNIKKGKKLDFFIK